MSNLIRSGSPLAPPHAARGGRGSPDSSNVECMSAVSGNDRIDDVSPGDIITLDGGAGERPYKLVFKDTTDAGYLLTLEGDGGETRQVELAAGTEVKRSLESKWESAQSPTANREQ